MNEVFMKKECYKLVRDRIPEIIRKAGKDCEAVIMSDTEYCQALRQKVIEEATELANASEGELATEIADLLEVIEALMTTYHISEKQVQLEQDQKRAQKGDFRKKVMLLWTE
ncbi:MAG: nucleoside triphosphate pyrophosphohydrolase [Microcoleaceae cyanobacterium]